VKIKLEMDRERAILLMRACETIARIGMSQFKDMVELLSPDTYTWDKAEEIEKYLKEKLAPELGKNSFHSISNYKVPEECQVAWDAYQAIRREVSWFDIGKDWRTDQRDWNKMMGVNFDEPFKASKIDGDFKTERLE
jgi:hypothetical protein